MNQRELNEIRRRIKPERNSISHIYGCYVNGAKEIISYIDESVGLLMKEEQEKYMSLLKKSLSGALGKNLVSLSFATKQVMDSDEHRLLSALRKTELKDAVLREEFYRCIINSLQLEDSNYLILLEFVLLLGQGEQLRKKQLLRHRMTTMQRCCIPIVEQSLARSCQIYDQHFRREGCYSIATTAKRYA